MILQGLKAPIDKSFVVTESDVDAVQYLKAVDDFPAHREHSFLDCEGFHLTSPHLTGRNRRVSVCSSSTSSICSKRNVNKNRHPTDPLKYEAPIEKPFVVTESDIDIFSCQEDQDNVEILPLCYPIVDFEDFHHTSPRLTGTKRRSSIRSSSSSSIGSKSLLKCDDVSFVSCGDQSAEASLRNSDRRKHRRRYSSIRTPKKKVTFHPQVNVRAIPKLNSLPEEELTSRWYQNYELAHIKNEVTETIRMAKNKELPAENDQNTLRGLHMPKKQRRRSLWIMALTCVLDEQKQQARDQVNDPETLAKLYSSFTFTAKQMAQEMARLDAKTVQEDNET